MSIRFCKNKEWVELETFDNKEVSDYLNTQINYNDIFFRRIAKARLGNCELFKYKDVYFMIHAEKTCIELSFEKADRKKMEDIINTIKKWNKFSKTESTFYIEFKEGISYTVIFENGYEDIQNYKRRFKNIELKVTNF